MAVTRGPNQARVNLAIYRQQLIGKNKLIMRWLPHRGGAQDFGDRGYEIEGGILSGCHGHVKIFVSMKIAIEGSALPLIGVT